ncbi:MAG: Fe-S cluster assembly protein SufD [Jiangellales bacterium]
MTTATTDEVAQAAAPNPLAAGVPAAGHGGSSLHRMASADLAAHPVPTGREEDWRFTPLRRLRGLLDSVGSDATVTVEVDAPEQVAVESLTGAQARSDVRRGMTGYLPVDRPSALAWEATEQLTVITVPTEANVEQPVFVTLRGTAVEGSSAGHVVIDAKPFSKAVVVLDHDGSASYLDNVEVNVGDNASLTVVSVQDWADDAVHLSHHHVRVGRDSTARHISISFGGDVVRQGATVSYGSTGGDVEMLGLYFADAGQHLEHRLYVDHDQPHCRSNVIYKGALQGDGAHTVWVGDVLIRPTAVGIDTYELNRNLVLTDGTRADSVPNLEIETGEIEGAGHASATGRFDDEQLFYLQARGIPEDEARRLVVRGFFAELINRIGVPQLVERLITEVEAELEGAKA